MMSRYCWYHRCLRDDCDEVVRLAREEKYCQLAVFAVGKAVRKGRMDRGQIEYARRDLKMARWEY